jgi:hypothetical protein
MKEFCTQSVLVEPSLTAPLQTSQYHFALRQYMNLVGTPYPISEKLHGGMVTAQLESHMQQIPTI